METVLRHQSIPWQWKAGVGRSLVLGDPEEMRDSPWKLREFKVVSP